LDDLIITLYEFYIYYVDGYPGVPHDNWHALTIQHY